MRHQLTRSDAASADPTPSDRDCANEKASFPSSGACAAAASDGGAPPAATCGGAAVCDGDSGLIPATPSGAGVAMDVDQVNGAAPPAAKAAVPPSIGRGGAEAGASLADNVASQHFRTACWADGVARTVYPGAAPLDAGVALDDSDLDVNVIAVLTRGIGLLSVPLDPAVNPNVLPGSMMR